METSTQNIKTLTIKKSELDSFYNCGRIRGKKLGYQYQPNPIELQIFFGGSEPDAVDGGLEYQKLRGNKKPTAEQLEKEVKNILKHWKGETIDHIDLSIDIGDELGGKDTEEIIIYIRK